MFLLQKRPLLSSERALRNNRRFFYKALGAAFLFLVLLFFVSWGSRREEVTIANVTIVGTASVAENEVRAFVDDALIGTYWGLFPRKNSLIYPKDALERGLFENFPHIASAVLLRGSFKELFVEIKERVPSYLWCGSTLLATGGEEQEPIATPNTECYFLDPRGVVFAKAPYFSGSVYFEMYGALSGTNVFTEKRHAPPVGLLFLPLGEFKRVVAFKSALEEAGIPAEKLVLKEEGDPSSRAELTTGRDAEFIFSNGTRLIFNFQENFETVLHNLLAATNAEPLPKEVFTGAEKVFDYVDARFENRIFYK